MFYIVYLGLVVMTYLLAVLCAVLCCNNGAVKNTFWEYEIYDYDNVSVSNYVMIYDTSLHMADNYLFITIRNNTCYYPMINIFIAPTVK